MLTADILSFFKSPASAIFNSLKSERDKACHNSLVAWLLNPEESHRLGEKSLRRFLYLIASRTYDEYGNADEYKCYYDIVRRHLISGDYRLEVDCVNTEQSITALAQDRAYKLEDYVDAQSTFDIWMLLRVTFKGDTCVADETWTLPVIIENDIFGKEEDAGDKEKARTARLNRAMGIIQNVICQDGRLQQLMIYLTPDKTAPTSDLFIPLSYQDLFDSVIEPLFHSPSLQKSKRDTTRYIVQWDKSGEGTDWQYVAGYEKPMSRGKAVAVFFMKWMELNVPKSIDEVREVFPTRIILSDSALDRPFGLGYGPVYDGYTFTGTAMVAKMWRKDDFENLLKYIDENTQKYFSRVRIVNKTLANKKFVEINRMMTDNAVINIKKILTEEPVSELVAKSKSAIIEVWNKYFETVKDIIFGIVDKKYFIINGFFTVDVNSAKKMLAKSVLPECAEEMSARNWTVYDAPKYEEGLLGRNSGIEGYESLSNGYWLNKEVKFSELLEFAKDNGVAYEERGRGTVDDIEASTCAMFWDADKDFVTSLIHIVRDIVEDSEDDVLSRIEFFKSGLLNEILNEDSIRTRI